MEEMTVDLEGCTRCGGVHAALRFGKFTHPVELCSPLRPRAGVVYEWWALCPTTGEPILMTVRGAT